MNVIAAISGSTGWNKLLDLADYYSNSSNNTEYVGMCDDGGNNTKVKI